MTKEYFLEKAKLVHGDRYDYTKSVVGKKREKVCIICPEHGEFWQTPEHHFQGHGCPKCGEEKSKNRETKLKYDKEDFIKSAKEVHGNKYIYDKTVYNGIRHNKICITCPEHGDFYQWPYVHLYGCGCPKCALANSTSVLKSNTEEFIKKAKRVHKKKYDYSKVEYVDNKTKVCIICPEHGEFWQTPKQHLKGQGCPKCGGTYSPTTEEFIKKAKRVHGDRYDYSKVKYVNAVTEICIVCPEHGEFLMKPNSHLNGQGCPCCGLKKRIDASKSNTKEFIEKSKKIHGDKYDYSKVDYINSTTKVCIICPKHGEFWQTPSEHLSGHGCKKCNTSHLEKEVMLFLEENNIKYEFQKRFTWLGRKSVDFYLPNNKIVIECQGEQHYRPVKYFGGEKKYKECVKRDLEKLKECKKRNIQMVYFTHENVSNNDTYSDINELLKILG